MNGAQFAFLVAVLAFAGLVVDWFWDALFRSVATPAQVTHYPQLEDAFHQFMAAPEDVIYEAINDDEEDYQARSK